MKIRTKHLSYEKVMALPRPRHRNPMRPLWLLQTLIRLLSIPTLMKTRFSFTTERMELVGNQPALILMNHSSFTDLKIAYGIFYPRPMCIVSTTDGYIGKRWLMPLIGCIPTQKFVSDMTLIRDMRYALTKKKASVLMFPEAGYTLDGQATVLPQHLGVILKRLKAPVVMVNTWGAFARIPSTTVSKSAACRYPPTCAASSRPRRSQRNPLTSWTPALRRPSPSISSPGSGIPAW